MKKTLLALAALLLSPLAVAEVAGIYVSPDDPGLIVTVNRNGNSLLLLQHVQQPEYSSVNFADGQFAAPVALYAQSYQLGQLSADGLSSTVVGTGAAGACTATYQLKFSDAGLRITLQSLQQPAASTFGVDCSALSGKLKADQQSAGGAPLLVKIF